MAQAVTNELSITSITHQDGCTTLTWRSRPGEHYRVFWTDAMGDRPFWRVGAFCVPSGGTNTTWSEGCEGMQAMAPGGAGQKSAEQPALTEEEKATRWDEQEARIKAALEYLESKLKEATEAAAKLRDQRIAGEVPLESPPPSPGSPENNGLESAGVTARFYRVARLAHGFMDGWGAGVSNFPPGVTNAVALAASGRDLNNTTPFVHNLLLRCDGTVAAWGANTFGQTNVPTNLVGVVAMAAGGRHSVALKEDGTIAVWGDNSFGQVTNVPPNLTNVVDVKAGLWHNIALRRDGTVAVWGDLFNRSNAVPPGVSNVIAIAAGPRHCLVLFSNRTVRGWGFSYEFLQNFLPTNTPPGLTNVVAISAGIEHNQALLQDGTVVVWGNTNNAGTALPAAITNATAIAAGWHFGNALLENGSVEGWGETDANIGRGLNDVVGLAAGAGRTLVIRTNADGLRIVRQPANISLPIGTNATLSVSATNRSATPIAYQWQKNGTNLPGATNSTLNFPALTDADDGLYRVLVSSGTGSLWSRQASVTNIHLPVITNQTPELNLRRPQGTTLTLSVGVHSKGSMSVFYSWYHDGVETFNPAGRFLGVDLRTAADEGAYWVVVRNPAGSVTSQVWTVKVTLRGEATGWGDNSEGQATLHRNETNLVALAAGGLHSLGLRENGTVLAWGDNLYGQTNVPAGLSNATAIAAGGGHSLALRKDRTLVAWGLNNHGQTNVPANATNILSITAGNAHSLALRRDGVVVGWGDPTWDAVAIPSNLTNVVAVAAGDGLSYALLSNGTVRAWGSGGLGTVVVPANLGNVVKLAAGSTHALALKSDGTVTCLGQDSGWGETFPPAGLSNVLQVTGGYQFSAALLNDGTVRAWGRHDAGQTNPPAGLTDQKQVAAGGFHCLSLAYEPLLNYPIRPADDLLVIYNTNSAQSVALKDYYLAHRPLVADAMTLGLGCQTGERFDNFDQMTNQLIKPVIQWLEANPTRRPEYYLLMFDIPSSYPDPFNTNLPYFSVQWHLREAVPVRKPMLSHLNMATLTDCTNYVNKLAFFGSNYSPGQVVISPRSGGYSNLNYQYSFTQCLPSQLDLILTTMYRFTGTSNQIVCQPVVQGQPTDATNSAGFFTGGNYSGLGSEWGTNGSVRFFGGSSWNIIASGESVNGMWSPLFGQGSFQRWFEKTSFGGTNYENAAVAAHSHTAEPGPNFTPFRVYWALWEQGKYFPIVVWNMARLGSSNLPFSGSYQSTGDPFIRR